MRIFSRIHDAPFFRGEPVERFIRVGHGEANNVTASEKHVRVRPVNRDLTCANVRVKAGKLCARFSRTCRSKRYRIKILRINHSRIANLRRHL